MEYRVREGVLPVRWPDGTVRASSGEVFDGLDVPGTPTFTAASRWLAGQRARFVPAPGEEITAGHDIPDAMQEHLRQLATRADGSVAHVRKSLPEILGASKFPVPADIEDAGDHDRPGGRTKVDLED